MAAGMSDEGTDGADQPEGARAERATRASRHADRTLRHQRDAHEPDHVETDDEGIGALVNNTGLDGDAATG
jgi:hypothetical protein